MNDFVVSSFDVCIFRSCVFHADDGTLNMNMEAMQKIHTIKITFRIIISFPVQNALLNQSFVCFIYCSQAQK